MRLILVGPPGSGKGTQAKLLSERLRLAHISTGDILREAKRLGTPTGKKAAAYMDAGQLVPDDVVNDVIADKLRAERLERFIMDGYPRTPAQAAAFDRLLAQLGLDVQAVVLLQVPDEVIVERLKWRWSCPQCGAVYHARTRPPKVEGRCDVDGTTLVQRADDREETIRQRLKVYHQQTAELVPYYRGRGILREVQGEGDIETIYAAIVAAL